MRDSIEPYIFGSMGLIHAGCTTGIQSELGSVKTIDLTRLFEDQDQRQHPRLWQHIVQDGKRISINHKGYIKEV